MNRVSNGLWHRRTFLIALLLAVTAIMPVPGVIASNHTDGESNQSSSESSKRIVKQGTITSSQDPLENHGSHQAAVILPLSKNGSIYSGTITFTASEFIDILVLQRSAFENDTIEEFGQVLTSVYNDTNVALSVIKPHYLDSSVASATVSFVGDALILHEMEGRNFIATFAVDAELVPANLQNEISGDKKGVIDTGERIEGSDTGQDSGEVPEIIQRNEAVEEFTTAAPEEDEQSTNTTTAAPEEDEQSTSEQDAVETIKARIIFI